VRRWDSEAQRWRDDRRTYDPDTQSWRDGEQTYVEPQVDDGEPLHVVWVDLGRLHWEARLTYADGVAAEAAAGWLMDEPDTVTVRDGRRVSVYAASEGAARELSATPDVEHGLELAAVRKLSRAGRWLLAQRLAGTYHPAPMPGDHPSVDF
jgi:hypothetical protein